MNEIKVLDHGFVRLLNVAGPTRRQVLSIEEGGPFAGDLRDWDADDTDPANSARMSFGQRDSGRTREQDLKLVRYLLEHHHTTPIEMIETWWEMKLPIFVARQLVRHRTCAINEISGRYVSLPDEFYIPNLEQIGAKSASGGNKQGRSGIYAHAAEFAADLMGHSKVARKLYEEHLSSGLAPEIARLLLPVNQYTQWLWKQDLHNLLHMLQLRLHPHAQWETQQYAQAMLTLLRGALPELVQIWETLQ